MAPGMFWGWDKQGTATTSTIILAFYFIDPFPMFLVRDHFSCKYAPRIKAACNCPTCFLAFASFYALRLKRCVEAIRAVNAVLWQPGEQNPHGQTNKQTNKQTDQQTNRPTDYITCGRGSASG